MTLPHIGLALLINIIWGFSFVAAKIGIEHYSPLFFTALRFFLVALFLVVYLKPVKGSMKLILAIGVLVGIIHFTFLYLGLSIAGGVSAVAITIQLVAPFSLVMAVLFLGESVGWRRISGMILAFSGVLILGFDPIVFEHLDGVMLVALAAFCMAGGLILMRTVKGVGTMSMQAWIGLVSFPGMMALSFLFEDGQIASLQNIEWQPITALLFTTVITTIFAHGGWFYLLQKYPISILTPYGLLAPIFGVGFGVLLYDEPITWKFILGGCITLVGVFVINIRTATREEESHT
ncbi:MAG: EamA family transporter [Sneathiella sp.]